MSVGTSYADHVDTRTGIPPPRPDDISELDKVQRALKHSLKSLANVVGASRADVPDDTGDGSRLSPEEKNALYKRIEGDLRDLSHLGVSNVKSLIEIEAQKLAGEPMDDKKYLMEGLIRTAASLPDDSKNRKTLTDQFLTQLWTDLDHPPQSYLGEKFQYRSADGSFNSLVHPQLGAAGTPYARTVKPVKMQTPALPDAGVVFDSVMTRKHAELHPNRISSVLFYLASIIIHDCFRTDHTDYATSLTSSYLDLSPLYGSNQEEQNQMRTFADGRLKPDCFSEARLLLFPPGVGCLLIMFNRFHNHVVENLALINEGGRFNRPQAPDDTEDKKKNEAYQAKLKKFDNDLFQTGRLITCGLYVNTILIDYVRTILDLNRTDSNWQLNPRADIKDVAIGVGNQVSAEFNLVYRWHSTISDRDEKWTQQLWDNMFGGNCDPSSIGGREFLKKLGEIAREIPADPSKRDFADIKRNEDGTLPDQPLVDILTSSIKDCANSFGPNRVPAVMRAIEVLGIEQARSWNLGSLNEFRKYFNLEPHRSFEDISSDPYVAEQLKHLYDHPDKVEIYPGIVVEDAKDPMCPGSGLTPPYTVSRAVLSDAVALVRGDRFYTLDYNPRTLTNWGYRTVDSDLDVDNGCVFYKLFLNAFPRHFKPNSVFVHYPLTIPDAMEFALKDIQKDHLYDFSEPSYSTLPHEVHDYETAARILKEKEAFKITHDKSLLGNYTSNPSSANGAAVNVSKVASTMSKVLYTDGWEKIVRSFYTTKTRELLKSKSCRIASFNQIDIIRDVGNMTPVHFSAETFMLPIKTSSRPRGIFSELELYTLLSGVSSLSTPLIDPIQRVNIQTKTHVPLKTLEKIAHSNVKALKSSGLVSSLIGLIVPDDIDDPKSPSLQSYGGKHVLKRLLEAKVPPKDIVDSHIIDTAAHIVSTQGELFAQIIEFFLLGPGAPHWPKIQSLAQANTDDAFATLTRCVLEAIRLNGEPSATVTATKQDTVPSPSADSQPNYTPVFPGDHILLNLPAALKDPAVFPDPANFDINRPLEAYLAVTPDPYGVASLTRVALTAMLKEVAGLKGLKPAKGPQGQVHKVGTEGIGKGYHRYLNEMWDAYWEYPAGEFFFFPSFILLLCLLFCADGCVALKVNWDV